MDGPMNAAARYIPTLTPRTNVTAVIKACCNLIVRFIGF